MQEVRRVQRLVGEHGRLGAISRVEHEERRLVEIVAGYGADEEVGMPAFLYSGWCLTALPHSRIPDADAWELSNGALTLLVEPGRRVLCGGGTEFVGVPYGATARLLLVYLQTQALRTGSRRIELGGSMKAWFDRLEKTPGGKSYRLVRDQAERIAMAKFSFHSERGASGRLGTRSLWRRGCYSQTTTTRANRRCSARAWSCRKDSSTR